MKKVIKQTVTLTIGISNSGKSTWAREQVANNANTIDINRDDIRIDLFCEGDRSKYSSYNFGKAKEARVTEIASARAEEAIREGNNIIISDTNLNRTTRDFWKNFCQTNNLEYVEKLFNVPLSTCLSRNLKRDITIPERVILRQYSTLRKILDLPIYDGRAEEPPHVVVFGFEDVLRTRNGGLKHSTVGLARMLKESGVRIVVIAHETYLTEAENWLNDNKVPFDEVFAKSTESHSEGDFKENIFWRYIVPKYIVDYVVDHNGPACAQWRSIGVECWKVGEAVR